MKRKTIRQLVKEFNSKFDCFYKPGYPVGRNQYLVGSDDKYAMFEHIGDFGLKATRVLGVGHDYNYEADLYQIDYINGKD